MSAQIAFSRHNTPQLVILYIYPKFHCRHMNFIHLIRMYAIVGSVQVATVKLAMDDFWVAWVVFGIQNVSAVIVVMYQYPIMRYDTCKNSSGYPEFLRNNFWRFFYFLFIKLDIIMGLNYTYCWIQKGFSCLSLQFSMSENRPFHKSCYKERHHPKCDVCKNYVSGNFFNFLLGRKWLYSLLHLWTFIVKCKHAYYIMQRTASAHFVMDYQSTSCWRHVVLLILIV